MEWATDGGRESPATNETIPLVKTVPHAAVILDTVQQAEASSLMSEQWHLSSSPQKSLHKDALFSPEEQHPFTTRKNGRNRGTSRSGLTAKESD